MDREIEKNRWTPGTKIGQIVSENIQKKFKL
jgi:hypothetical protein